MGFPHDYRTCYNCRINGGAAGMGILILAAILIAADQVRVRVQFGRSAQFLTLFSTALFCALTVLPVEQVVVSAVIASVGSMFFESNEWIKRVVNAASFTAASVASCAWVYFFGNDLAGLVAAGVIFEVVNFTSLGIAFVTKEKMTLGELADEWPSTAYLAILSPFIGFGVGWILLNVPVLFPLLMGGLILVLRPGYFVFVERSLLRGSWHTTPDTFQSLSKLSPIHNHYG